MIFSVELNVDAREKSGDLYCLRCHDKMGIPICGACRLVWAVLSVSNYATTVFAEIRNEHPEASVLFLLAFFALCCMIIVEMFGRDKVLLSVSFVWWRDKLIVKNMSFFNKSN